MLIINYIYTIYQSLFFPRYYNTGEQMIRRADVHLKDHQLEEAFVLYLKYMM